MPYKKVLYTVHTAEDLAGRDIRRQAVESVLQTGERTENYPHDPLGASYLMLG